MDENPIYESQYTIQQIEDSIGKTPIIDPDTKEWKVWDIGTSAYVGTGIIAESETYADAAAASAQVAQDYADNIADPVGGIVAQWIADNLSQETGYVIDTSLTVKGAAADAKTVGTKLSGALTNRGNTTSAMDINSTTFARGGQWYVPSSGRPTNFPFSSSTARIIVFGADTTAITGKTQVVISASGSIAYRTGVSNAWNRWRYFVNNEMIDSTLSIEGDAADAKAAGDAVDGALTYRGYADSTMDINDSDFLVSGQWNVNSGDYPNGSDPDDPHFPFSSSSARIIVFGSRNLALFAKVQLVISAAGGMAYRWRTRTGWYKWHYVMEKDMVDSTLSVEGEAADAATVGNLSVLGYPTMITTTAMLETLVESKSANDFPRNRVVVIGSSSVDIADGVTIGTKVGLYATLNYRADRKSGAAQIFINKNGFASRFNAGGTWSDWSVFQTQDKSVYYVGPNREIKSLTELWMTIGDDNTPKTVYVDPGEYDVFQEYVDNNVPVPPDGTSTANYKPYCANIPSNTKIIGLGDVVLLWEPTAEQITQIEAQIWSVINIYGADVEIENITIRCKNVRYAIHDDPHNDFPGCRHVFRDVRIYRSANDSGLGNFGQAFGVGWMDRSYYLYEGVFVDNRSNQVNSIPVYGHEGNTGSSAGAYDGAVLDFKNCTLLSDNAYSAKFQTINTTGAQQKIQVFFADCWIPQTIWLDQHTTGSSGQFFALTLLNSGDPEFSIDTDNNPYPVRCYDRDHVPLAITQQPQDQSASASTKVYFTVAAVGAGLKYLWQYSADGGTTWSNTTFVGYRTNTLQVTATEARNGYKYHCIVSAASGEVVVSDAGTLTVS